MAKKVFNALLFETQSIKKYVYSGNRLATTIGAAYIADRIFFDVLIDDVLKKIFPDEDFPAADDFWDISKDAATPWENMKSCCVAYVGGGNALLLFKPAAEDKRVEVVKNFTRKLLVARPGLKICAALGELELRDGKINRDIDELYRRLKENQNNIFPAVNVPCTGLTLSCEVDGEAANFYDKDAKKFYSQETAAKIKFADDANKNFRTRFEKIFATKNFSAQINFAFPSEIERLGQKAGKNFFAIVHVNGNNTALKFQACKNLSERRKFSREIRRKTEGAFADLLAKIIRMKRENLFGDALNLKGIFLPIRPLIVGDAVITFLCPANMAIIFTKTLVENLDACAGIAILPTKYPFSRGFELAEQLCDAAKKSMRKLLPPDFYSKENFSAEDFLRGSSWLDFAILHGEQAPTLEQFFATEYSGARGNLHFGAYRLGNSAAEFKRDRLHNIENLISCTEQFPHVMANNKIKELRGILQRGKDDTAKFLRQLHYQNQDLPEVPDWDNFKREENLLWHDGATPYTDAIELIKFYDEEAARQWKKLM